jgi:hypothetical protein
MMPRLTRRAMLSLPLVFASCGDDESPAPVLRRDFSPLNYSYIPPINLNVQRLEVAGDFVPSTADGEIINTSPINAADTLYAMASDRLKPVATSGIATFRILTASIIRHRDTLNGVLAIRLDVHNGDDTSSGYAEARVTATHTGPISDQRAAVYDMLKSMMDNMNVELEYQLRNKLRAWIVEPASPPPSTQPAEPPSQVPPQPEPVEPPPELQPPA